MSLCLFNLYIEYVHAKSTPWTIASQAPLSMGFPRQEYWSGLPFPSSGDLPNQGIKPESPALQGRFFTIEPPGNIQYMVVITISFIVSTFSSCSSKKKEWLLYPGDLCYWTSITDVLFFSSSYLPFFFLTLSSDHSFPLTSSTP